jgi:hypothetical protein
VAVEAIYVRCSWCEAEQTFTGPDPETEAREAGWFQLVDHEEEPLDFCSGECLKSWLF